MATQAEGPTWAQQLTREAFAECGVKLRDGDSLILVATVLRRVLEVFSAEQANAVHSQLTNMRSTGDAVGENVRAVIAAEFGAQAKKLRTELLGDAASASVEAKAAVKEALTIPERKNLWKARGEGLFVGAALVLSGAILLHLLSH